MKDDPNVVAYIDGANLHKGVQSLGWQLDYARFRAWLSHRFGIGKAYLFIGMIPKYKNLYTHLGECGFLLVYKEVVYGNDGRAKGNCDADLIVRAMQDAYEGTLREAIIVTSDGDYAPLIEVLLKRKQLHAILSPSPSARCSVLLKRTGARIVYLDDKKALVSPEKKRPPAGTHPHKGPSRSE